MKNIKLSFIVVFGMICLGCAKDQSKVLVCTAEYVTIGVNFLDKQGKPITVQNFSAINTRTNQSIKYAGAVDLLFRPGFYTVATDGDRQEVSTNGDDILVSATNPSTMQTKTIVIKVASNMCHISKVSGNDQISFD